jgi:hypothetical protein
MDHAEVLIKKKKNKQKKAIFIQINQEPRAYLYSPLFFIGVEISCFTLILYIIYMI